MYRRPLPEEPRPRSLRTGKPGTSHVTTADMSLPWGGVEPVKELIPERLMLWKQPIPERCHTGLEQRPGMGRRGLRYVKGMEPGRQHALSGAAAVMASQLQQGGRDTRHH